MTSIDVSSWRKFQLIDVFEMKNTKSIPAAIVRPDSGDVPYVTAQQGNNGVQTYINCPSEWLEEGQCILIGGKTLTFSYQEKAFCSNDSHNIALYLKKKPAGSPLVHLFLIAVLRARFSQLFSWSDSISMRRAKELSVELPVSSNGQPDWGYMQLTMERQITKVEGRLHSLLAITATPPRQIDTSSWSEFSLKELGFTNFHGERLNKAHRIPGQIPFITAGKINRGVAQYIDTDRTVYHKAITVDMFGNCFFQNEDCTGDDNVYFFINDQLTDEHKLYISCSINVETSRIYAYKEQFRQPNADALSVKLPVDATGRPDWQYMSYEIKRLLGEAGQSLKVLEGVKRRYR